MLSKRYKNDGKAIFPLNELQLATKKQIEEKIERGIYQFESVPCCICKGNDFELLSQKDRDGLYMPVVICKHCGLIQTNPRMNQDSYNQFYRYEYRKLYNEAQMSTDELFSFQYKRGQAIYQYLQSHCKFLEPLSCLSVLEVGCSVGGILKYFKEKGCHVKGVDLDEEYVSFGNKHYQLDLALGSLNDVHLEFEPDIIIYAHVLEHILAPKEELSCVKGKIADNGILYIEVPSVQSLLKNNTDFLQLLQNAHVYYFTPATLQNLLVTNGFQMLASDEVIRSIWKKSSKSSEQATHWENDYKAMTGYLKRCEKLRGLMSALVKLLKLTRLYSFVAAIYQRLKSRGKPL